MNDEHVPHRMHARTPKVHVELEQRISNFGVAPRGDPGEGGSERGTTDQRKHHLTAIGVRG